MCATNDDLAAWKRHCASSLAALKAAAEPDPFEDPRCGYCGELYAKDEQECRFCGHRRGVIDE